MRSIGLIIAFSFALAGASFSSTDEGSLPGVGAFSYGPSRVATDMPSVKFARLTLTRRA